MALSALMVPLAALAAPTNIARMARDNPFATFSTQHPKHWVGGCYNTPTAEEMLASARDSRLVFTEKELQEAREGPVSIDWRKHGAVAPVQQQHPFGTCWAFSMIAVTEAVMVIQGKQPLTKLSEQMVISCVPEDACGDNSDVLWSWALHHTDGQYQADSVYPYNRTCNFFREQQLAPDGTNDGYTGTCNLPGPPPYAPCPPCPGVSRKDGTPACRIDKNKGFSKAQIKGWGFISPHGEASESPYDVTRMVAALKKYGPAQIGIDASCLQGYTSGIITNCTSRNVDHAVAIVGADTDPSTGIDYWIVRNSWNTTFGEDGYFRVQRDTQQMGIFGGYFGCYNENCMIDP